MVSQADAEDGDAAEELGDDLADAADGVRVAGAVREEDAVGMQAQHVARRRRRRDDADAATGADQVPEDVELDAEVVRDDELWLAAAPGGGFLRPRVATAETPRPLVPVVRLGARDLLHEVAADESRRLLRLPDEPLGVQVDARQHRLLRADVADVTHEGARVDALDRGDPVPREVRAEPLLGPPRRGRLTVLAHDEATHVRPARLDVLAVHADVADLRVRHRHELPLVRRVGQDLLVPGHAGVEDELAHGLGLRAEGAAAKHRTVGQGEQRRARAAHEAALRSAAAIPGRSS